MASGWFRFGSSSASPNSPRRRLDEQTTSSAQVPSTAVTCTRCSQVLASPSGSSSPVCIACSGSVQSSSQFSSWSPPQPVTPRRKRLAKCSNCSQQSALPGSKFCSVDCESTFSVVAETYAHLKLLQQRQEAAAMACEVPSTLPCKAVLRATTERRREAAARALEADCL